MISASPTHLPHSEKLHLGGIECTTFDLGGHAQARRIWKDYFTAIDAVVFIVDCANEGKLQTAADELSNILADKELASCPVLIFGNKIDKPGALSEEDLLARLNIVHAVTGKNDTKAAPSGDNDLKPRQIELFMCSILMEVGYGDGFRWLSKLL